MINMKKVELELVPAPDMFIFFEKDMRDESSYISSRYRKTKNRYLKSCDPKQELKHIVYLDENTLYGYAMSKVLLTTGFKCIDSKDVELNKYTSNSSKGHILKVELEYPKELHEL